MRVPMLRIALLALACAGIWLAPLPGHLPRAYAQPGDVLGLPLPPGTRIDTGGTRPAARLLVSGRGFRPTVEHFQRVLTRRGLLHQAIPVQRYRGTVVARFLSRQPGTAWSAIHVYQHEARTWIFIVPASPP